MHRIDLLLLNQDNQRQVEHQVRLNSYTQFPSKLPLYGSFPKRRQLLPPSSETQRPPSPSLHTLMGTEYLSSSRDPSTQGRKKEVNVPVGLLTHTAGTALLGLSYRLRAVDRWAVEAETTHMCILKGTQKPQQPPSHRILLLPDHFPVSYCLCTGTQTSPLLPFKAGLLLHMPLHH